MIKEAGVDPRLHYRNSAAPGDSSSCPSVWGRPQVEGEGGGHSMAPLSSSLPHPAARGQSKQAQGPTYRAQGNSSPL